jgi:hypothetical protein
MTKSLGFIYCATGKRHCDEAICSIESLLAVEDTPLITVFTDKDCQSLFKHLEDKISLNCLVAPSYSWDDKIAAISCFPYDFNAFLDADTIIIRPLAEDIRKSLTIADVLAQPNMAFNLAWEAVDFPACVNQFNTGVIFFRRNENTSKMVETWRKLRELHPESHDQPTFRAAILSSNVKFLPLANSHNFQGISLVYHPVSIIHLISPRMRNLRLRGGKAWLRELREIGKHKTYSLCNAAECGFMMLNGKWRITALTRTILFELQERLYLNSTKKWLTTKVRRAKIRVRKLLGHKAD